MYFVRGYKGSCSECPTAVRTFDSEFEARTECHKMVRTGGYTFADVVVTDAASPEPRIVCLMAIEREEK